MRVLYFSREYTTHDRNFLGGLARRGVEPWFLRLEDSGAGYDKRPLPPGVKLAKWKGGSKPFPKPSDWMALLPDLERVVAAVKPDVIHAGPLPSCGFMAALTGFSPLMVMSWGSDVLKEAREDPKAGRRARFALKNSKGFVCDADAVREEALSWAPYRGRVIQFPWGIDVRRFSPGKSAVKLPWNDAVVALSTRTWAPVYGTETIVEGFRRARLKDERLKLVMLGDGPLAPKILRGIRAARLEEHVHLAGRVAHDALPDWFRAADVYVGASYSDGTSISLLEAMGCGLPVLVTGIPGNREWVKDGVHGKLFRPGDAAGFARGLLALARRDYHGKAGRAVVVKRADWEKNLDLLIAGYRSLSRGSRRRRR